MGINSGKAYTFCDNMITTRFLEEWFVIFDIKVDVYYR